jgi:RNA polymerase sigma-70 factor (ECF subfamily)
MAVAPSRLDEAPLLAEGMFERHAAALRGFCIQRTASRADGEEAVQATFLRALRAMRAGVRPHSERAWLLTIARNALIDHQRRRRIRREDPIGQDGVDHDELPPSAEPGPDLGISPELAKALGTLKPREREVVALRFGGDLTGPEIAEMLGLSLANVQQLLSRSLRRLRDELGQSPTTD